MFKTSPEQSVSITALTSSIGVRTLSDSELYKLCCQYGEVTLLARRKFLGLLPEVARRKLYLQKGHSSIFVFAAKLAGISEEQVRLALNLESKFRDKPTLHIKLTKGEISINKLARVASVVTPQNADFWAAQAENLPQSALETLVRDERSLRAHSNPTQLQQKSIFKAGSHDQDQNAIPTPAVASPTQLLQLQLSSENLIRLLELQNMGIDINTLISEVLDRRESEIAEGKATLAAEQESKSASSRHIPVSIRRLLAKEYGDKCAIPTCNKPSLTIHHTAPFALVQMHNPYFMVPFCQDHHKIAHLLNQKYQLHF